MAEPTQPVVYHYSGKERAFVEHYFILKFNGTQAAKAAGYAGDENVLAVTANRLLRKAKIKALIDERFGELVMSANEALARLSLTARGDLADYLGLTVAELKAHPQSFLLKKVKRTLTTYGELPSAMTEEKIELELYDAEAAQVAILKEQHLRAGEATDVSDVRLKVPPLPDDQLDEIFKQQKPDAPGAGAGPD